MGDDLRYFIDFSIWHPDVRGSEHEDKLYFPPTEDKSSAQQFLEAYREEFGEEPDMLSAPGAFVLGYSI